MLALHADPAVECRPEMRRSYTRDSDGALMVEVSPGCFIASKSPRGQKLESKFHLGQSSDTNEDRAYYHLVDAGANGLLADEAVCIREKENGDGKPAVNQVAPVFSKFKKEGIVIWRGKRQTRLGSTAHVHILADNASELFCSVYGRYPKMSLMV